MNGEIPAHASFECKIYIMIMLFVNLLYTIVHAVQSARLAIIGSCHGKEFQMSNINVAITSRSIICLSIFFTLKSYVKFFLHGLWNESKYIP